MTLLKSQLLNEGLNVGVLISLHFIFVLSTYWAGIYFLLDKFCRRSAIQASLIALTSKNFVQKKVDTAVAAITMLLHDFHPSSRMGENLTDSVVEERQKLEVCTLRCRSLVTFGDNYT